MPRPLVPISQSPQEVQIPPSAAGQRARFGRAYSVLEEAIGRRAFPGAAFSVLAGKEILALDGVGAVTYQPGAPLVTASVLYDLASVTKVLATTSLAMLLYQRGKLPLDGRLAEWLPGFAGNEPAASLRRQVTLRMLLAHASGLPGYAPLFQVCRDRQTLFDACLHQSLEAAPGSRAEYSDLGFILLGRVLEAIAGEPLDRFCAREIFAPLGMSSTCFCPPPEWAPSIAPTEEDRSFRHRVVQGEVQDENCFVLGGKSGHAGLFSNVLDPLLYAECLLDCAEEQVASPVAATEPHLHGRRPPERIFDRETVRLFTSRAELPPGSSRALGWDTPSPPSSAGGLFSRRSAGHLGYTGTSLWIDFERRAAIVLLTNRTWPHRESEQIRVVRPAFHDAIMAAIRETL